MFGRNLIALVVIYLAIFSSVARAIDPLVSTRGANLLLARLDRSPAGNPASHRLPAAVDTLALPTVSGPLPIPAAAAIREVYVWGWPLVYMHNLKQSLRLIRSPGTSGGAPVAPINSLCMLSDVVSSNFRTVPCPNGDVIYGFGLMDLQVQPVVIQVPDFGSRFWMMQLGDHRMESFGQLGSQAQTRPGFYMVVGPQWQGDVPDTVAGVLRSPTNLAYILPRILAPKDFADHSTGGAPLETALSGVAMYSLDKFNGRMQRKDWKRVRWYPAIGQSNRQQSKLVSPAQFFDDLHAVLAELQPMATEEPLFQLAQRLTQLAQEDPAWKVRLQQLAIELESSTIAPMFDFAYSGQVLPGNWQTLTNGAAFGDDYWTRTAVAKSNPFVNRPQDAKYYYLERDASGQPLTGARQYTLTFPAGQLPPAGAFWSVTLYNGEHQFHQNELDKHSIGSWSRDIHTNPDGSVTITIGSRACVDTTEPNWLPAPENERFSLYLRIYAPQAEALDGRWTPPAVN